MSFYDFIQQTDFEALRHQIAQATPQQVARALSNDRIAPEHLPLLFSNAAYAFLEPMAQRAQAMTLRRFGRVINLYAPIYLSNECVNQCAYCGFAHSLHINRTSLSIDQAMNEAQRLHDEGFRHLLLVSGESRRTIGIPYLTQLVQKLNRLFSSISIEINPLNTDEYKELVQSGVDGLVIYQETYDPIRYKEVHLGGPKRHFANRLAAIESGGEAGMRSLGIGALLGLGEWRLEAALVVHHARYLTKRFWASRIGISFPRIRGTAGAWQTERPIEDHELVQMLCAARLILPDAELVISTREPAHLRDHLIGLGITRMSAGSKTNPGGYVTQPSSGEQFAIADDRSAEEVAAMIANKGYEPVWKDFDRTFMDKKAS